VKAFTEQLKRRLRRIHVLKGRRGIQSYLWVTERSRCWETRGLEDGTDDERRIAAGVYQNPVRDYTGFLNEDGWGALAGRLRLRGSGV
jgi:hypothetical protein